MSRTIQNQESWYELNNGISTVIKTIMDQRRLSSYAVEGLMNTSARELYKVLDGRRQWSLYLLYQVCEALDLNIHAVIREAENGH